MEITVTLPGSIRSKKNSKRVIPIGGVNKPRRHIIVPSKAYKQWEDAARASACEQMGLIDPTPAPVEVEVTAYYKGPEPDLSGVLESVGDCLEGIVWVNDRQIKSWDGSRVIHDKGNPRTVVRVRVYQFEDVAPLFGGNRV